MSLVPRPGEDCIESDPPRRRERERSIPLGDNETGDLVSIPGATLASGNLGIFGDSGSGKSWVTGLLAEGMRYAGYQVLLIDPEGDYRGMRTLSGMVSFQGNQKTFPSPGLVAGFLETITESVVLDLSSYPVNGRNQYIAELLSRLRILKERNCRPHWIVLEEAQQFLPPSGSLITDTLLPMLVTGGWAFVSYRPDRLANPVLQSLDHIVLTRLSEQEAIQALQRLTDVLKLSPEAIPRGYIWLCGNQVVRLRSSARRVPHIRHLHKRFYSMTRMVFWAWRRPACSSSYRPYQPCRSRAWNITRREMILHAGRKMLWEIGCCLPTCANSPIDNDRVSQHGVIVVKTQQAPQVSLESEEAGQNAISALVDKWFAGKNITSE